MTTAAAPVAADAENLASAAVNAAEAGDFTSAVDLFTKAIRLQPNNALLHEQYAQCLLELEQTDAAVHAARNACALKPTWPEVWLTLSRALLNDGQLLAARHACAKCLELEPAHNEAQQDSVAIDELLQQEACETVGLLGLKIETTPASQTGPGCVVWEAGVQLARLFVQLAAWQQQQQQEQQPLQTLNTCAVVSASACDHPPAIRPSVTPPTEPQHSTAAHAAQPSQLDTACWADLPLLWGAHVLELGAGTGIVGISAAGCGAHVTMTDLPAALPLLQRNIANNQQLIHVRGGSAAAAVLDWSDAQLGMQQLGQQEVLLPVKPCPSEAGCPISPASGKLCRQWDWGFGADLVFNAKQVEPVVTAITCLLSATGSGGDGSGGAGYGLFVLAHKQRHEEVDKLLLQALHAAGCCVLDICAPIDSASCAPTGRICVWLIRQVKQQGSTGCAHHQWCSSC